MKETSIVDGKELNSNCVKWVIFSLINISSQKLLIFKMFRET